MKALVTGACGFQGQNMVEFLAKQDHSVRAMDLPGADAGFVKSLGAEFVPADLTKKETLPQLLEGVETVFHVASLFDYSATYEQLHRVNVEGMGNLISALRDSDVKRIVHWSTEGVYGIDLKVPVTEEHPKNPVNPYNKTKWAQEGLVWKAREENGMPFTVIRPGPVYGPRSRYGVATVGNMVTLGQMPFVPLVLAKHRLPSVHVEDVTGAALHLSRTPGAVGEAYNVVDDALYSIYDLLLDAAQFAGGKVYRIRVSHSLMVRAMDRLARRLDRRGRRIGVRPPVEPNTVEYLYGNFWFSNEKLKKTGYELRWPDAKIGMRSAYKWYQQAGWI